jgi:hypothetical protein
MVTRSRVQFLIRDPRPPTFGWAGQDFPRRDISRCRQRVISPPLCSGTVFARFPPDFCGCYLSLSSAPVRAELFLARGRAAREPSRFRVLPILLATSKFFVHPVARGARVLGFMRAGVDSTSLRLDLQFLPFKQVVFAASPGDSVAPHFDFQYCLYCRIVVDCCR